MVGQGMTKKYLMVGTELSGAVTGRHLAEAGHDITIVDSSNHIGGNCHTARDPDSGIMLHVYGPHIFHTDDDEVWGYVNRFEEFLPFNNRVKTTCRDPSGKRSVFSLPINLHTINQLFGKTMRPDEAKRFIAEEQADSSIVVPKTFEDRRCVLLVKICMKPFSRVIRSNNGACTRLSCLLPS